MIDPGDLETYEETDEPRKVMDHIVCPNCAANGIYLCGMSREHEVGPILPVDGSFVGVPCAVCFSSPSLTCNGCGSQVITTVDGEASVSPSFGCSFPVDSDVVGQGTPDLGTTEPKAKDRP